MPPSEVVQQRFDRNTCTRKDWGPTQDIWIAVHDDALIFHRISSLVQCSTETHARLTAPRTGRCPTATFQIQQEPQAGSGHVPRFVRLLLPLLPAFHL